MEMPMPPEKESKGVMSAAYAAQRQNDPAISYRFRTRALTSALALLRHIDSSGPLRILDMGSADGTTLVEMARHLPAGTVLQGVEASAGLAALARDLGPNIRVLHGDMTALPSALGADAFDAVTALASIEHLERPVEAFHEAQRVLKPGGVLVASTPEPRWDALADRLHLLEDHHEFHLSRRDLLAFAGQAGLELVEYRRFMLAPVGFLPYLRIRLSPASSMALDDAARKLRLLDWMFVNQLLIARKA
jgi:SAM-dependent methyltransferase